MIEKLEKPKSIRWGDDVDSCIQRHKIIVDAISKINELVDAVNELQLTVSKMENLEHLKKIGQGFKNLQDPYAEQRKWIGKLCWFWDENPEDKIVDGLSHIDISNKHPYVMCDHQVHYKHCEPVKPNDDIIYKGE